MWRKLWNPGGVRFAQKPCFYRRRKSFICRAEILNLSAQKEVFVGRRKGVEADGNNFLS
jgi:hypothetical protein